MKEDILNRENFEKNIIKIIENLSNDKKGCMFAIDGSWGIGKSFVLEAIENEIEQIQSEETNDDKYLLFHYNCWEYDFYEEPAIAIISAMLDKAERKTGEKLKKKSKAVWEKTCDELTNVARVIIKNKIGIDLVTIADDVKTIEDENEEKIREFDNFMSLKKTINCVKEKMREISEQKTIVIVVDELDRCLPSYAIKVLERLHHFFEGIDNVIVIFAIDSVQLDQSIKSIFGDKTNTEKYLKKFMSFKVKLDYGKVQNNLMDSFSYFFDMYNDTIFNDQDIVTETVIKLFDASKIDIREKEKFIEKICMINKLISSDKIDCSIMLFELIVSICMLVKKDDELNRILKMVAVNEEVSASNMSKYFSEDFIMFLKDMNDLCLIREVGYAFDEQKKSNANSIALTKFYLKELYLDDNSEYNEYEKRTYREQLELCKKFDEYIRILN